MELVQSIINRDLNNILRILGNPDYDVNEESKKGSTYSETALMAAVSEAQDALIGLTNGIYIKIIKLILQHPKCDINYQTRYDDKCRLLTAAHGAVIFQRLAALQVLLGDTRCDINLQNRYGKTPFSSAVESAYVPFVKLLLQHPKCDINLQSKYGWTALHMAVTMAKPGDDHRQTLQLLMSDKRITPSLPLLDLNGQSVLTTFMTELFDMSKYEDQPYILEILDILLTKPSGINSARHTLALAVEKSPNEVCTRLLNKGVDVNSYFSNEETALMCAVRLDSYTKCELLVKYNANLTITSRGITPLEYGIAHGCSSAILQLLGKYVAMHVVEQYLLKHCYVGETPLTSSIRLGVTHWVNYFAKQQHTDVVLARDVTGLNALHLSCKNTDLHDMLLDISQVNTSSQNQKDMTEWYTSQKAFSTNLPARNIHSPEATSYIRQLQLINSSHRCNNIPESAQVTQAVFAVIETLASSISQTDQTAIFAFKPSLAGSTAEGTKTFVANEVDVLCQFTNLSLLEIILQDDDYKYNIRVLPSSPWSRFACEWQDHNLLNPNTVADGFADALEAILKKLVSQRRKFGNLYLQRHSLQRRDKIACLHLLWRGDLYRDMVVHVDMVPAFPCPQYKLQRPFPLNVTSQEFHLITKVSRLSKKEDEHECNFHLSTSSAEREVIRALPINCRLGLTKAKALRVASICSPAGFDTLYLTERVSSEDFITSYMLKTCLFHLLANNELSDNDTPYDVAHKIYTFLEQRVRENGRLGTYHHEYEDLFRCDHTAKAKVVVRQQCCLRNAVISRLCQQIIAWLGNRRAELEHLHCKHYGVHLVFSRTRHVMKTFLNLI